MSDSMIKFASGEYVPLEMHKVRVVQKLNLLPIEERVQSIEGAGFNTFLLKNRDVFRHRTKGCTKQLSKYSAQNIFCLFTRDAPPNISYRRFL